MTFDLPSPSADRQAARSALRRMLAASAGCFSFSVVTCDVADTRDRIVVDVRRGGVAAAVVRIPPGTVDVFAVAATATATTAGTRPAAVFVIGLEESIDRRAAYHPAVRSLNASRELWERAYRCPVVFWLPARAVDVVVRHAADFWRYRSHHFKVDGGNP